MPNSATSLLEQITDTNAFALYQLLRSRGFSREDNSPRIIEGQHVALAVNPAGYRVTFYSASEPSGLAVVDLPLTISYGTVETLVAGIEADFRWNAANDA
jgi:hypothetical protein